jgi:hypothetical protein
MTDPRPPDLIRRNGRYGFDGRPLGAAALAAAGLALALAAGLSLRGGAVLWAIIALPAGVLILAAPGTYLYATWRGKFVVWSRLLTGLELSGDERLLDLGAALCCWRRLSSCRTAPPSASICGRPGISLGITRHRPAATPSWRESAARSAS